MVYVVGRTYLEGSVLFIRRPRRTILDTEQDLRIILATDISSMEEAMEVAKHCGITTVYRVMSTRPQPVATS